MLLRHDQLIEFFPDIKTVKGLMYVEPAALEITSVMTQLRSVLFEYTTLADLNRLLPPLPENLQYQLIQSSQ
jgi:hypothetical protein